MAISFFKLAQATLVGVCSLRPKSTFIAIVASEKETSRRINSKDFRTAVISRTVQQLLPTSVIGGSSPLIESDGTRCPPRINAISKGEVNEKSKFCEKDDGAGA